MVESKALNERQSSQLSNDLSCRIQTNQKFGNSDLKSWILDKLNLKKGERLLDVGCGTGVYTIQFAKVTQQEWSCAGVDLSVESIKTAEKASRDLNLKIKFINNNMDEFNASQDPERYDTITSMYALYYSKNPALVLKNLSGMLKATGRIAILGPYMDNNKEWFDFLNQFMALPKNVIQSSSDFMHDVVLPFAWEQFSDTHCFRFVNRIRVPSLEDLKKYWESNTYYEAKYNEAFMKYAAVHFKNNPHFEFSKTALLILMNNRR